MIDSKYIVQTSAVVYVYNVIHRKQKHKIDTLFMEWQNDAYVQNKHVDVFFLCS